MFGSIICVGFCDGISSVELLLFPHCVSLKYFAANCALLSCVICCPSLSLLWYGVGLYFLLNSLIPNHLSLMSRSFDTDSRILVFLSCFLLCMNSLLCCRNSFGFLSLAACFFPRFSWSCLIERIFCFCP